MGAWLLSYRRSWFAAAALLLLALVLLSLEAMLRSRLHGDPGLSFGFVVPLLLGITLLSPRQMAALGLVVWSLSLLSHLLSHESLSAVQQFRLAARLVFVPLFVWMTRLDSQREHNRQELQRTKTELQSKLATSLRASALVHEIRQPLAALELSSRALLHQLEQQDHSSMNLRRQLDELQTLSRDIHQRLQAVASLLRCRKADHVPMDLAAVVRGSLQSLRRRLERSGISLIQRNLEQTQPLMGDPGQLGLCIDNLLRNAIEALEQNQGASRRLAVSLEPLSGHVRLVIADSGSGLPSTDLEALLLLSCKSDGLGLGLSICQTIASNHAGRLTAARSLALGGAELQLTLAAGSD